MIDILQDYYTDKLRIDITSAQSLAELNPASEKFAKAALNKQFVINVLQGDIYEGVYSVLAERFFDTEIEAREHFNSLVIQYPDAAIIDGCQMDPS